jgi:cytochrome c
MPACRRSISDIRCKCSYFGRQRGPRPACIRRVRGLSFFAGRPKHDRSKSRRFVESKGGELGSFSRYSQALQSANIVWNDQTLDDWITDPQHLVPGNEMTFAGIKDARQRADLLAFLKQATQPGASTAQQSEPMGGMGGMGGIGGMMGGRRVPNLKHLDPEDRVQAISYCKDTYTITTANGQTRKFWERNLRLKTDAGAEGPEKNVPALVGAGMMGDRADVIFADPSEIISFIVNKCQSK